MIIGKSRIEESNYDCLIFCIRNIRQIKIPNFIEHICSYSFEICSQLELIEIPDDSKLQTIGKNAFSNSKIKSLRIPSSVTSIGEYAFHCCNNLCIIEANNAEMTSIYQTALKNCHNVLIMIPVHENCHHNKNFHA